MGFLTQLINGVHFAMGITAPRPDQVRTVALIWAGSIVVFVGGLWLLLLYAF